MAGQCGKFCIRLGKAVLEMHETLRKTQTCDCFYWFKCGKIVVEDRKRAGCPITGHPRRNKKNSHNRRLIVWNMPVKSRRLQCVVDLHEEVCASVVHQWAAAGANFWCWKHSCGPYSLDMVPCNLFLFPRMKLPFWRCHWQDIWKTCTIIDWAMCHSKESVPVVLPVVVEMLNPSDEFGGVVLWREQQPLAKVFFISDPVQKLLDMPSYMVVLIHSSAERVKGRLHHNIIQWKTLLDNCHESFVSIQP